MGNTNLLFECSSVLLIVCVCGALAIVANRFGWWSNILVCVLGAVVMTSLFALATTLPDVAKFVVLGAFAALLWWLGNEQPAIDDLFDFQELKIRD